MPCFALQDRCKSLPTPVEQAYPGRNIQREDKYQPDSEGDLFSSIHFFVRAFSSEGIDEFLARIIAIEAALGMVRDHDSRSRPKVIGKDIGATKRIALRIAVLTGNSAKADNFSSVFKLRSDFVHGKCVDLIPPGERIMARSLAREVINKLFDAAIAEAGVGREQYLERLCP